MVVIEISLGPLVFHKGACGIPIGFLLDFHEIPMDPPWDFYGLPVGFPLYFSWIPMTFLWDFFGIPVGIPCYFYWISMAFLWGYYGGSIGSLYDFHEQP